MNFKKIADTSFKEGDKNKNKLMSFRIEDEKLLEKYKAIQTKTEDLKKIELNASPVYDEIQPK